VPFSSVRALAVTGNNAQQSNTDKTTRVALPHFGIESPSIFICELLRPEPLTPSRAASMQHITLVRNFFQGLERPVFAQPYFSLDARKVETKAVPSKKYLSIA
jgi:hypothetical protein